jgi:hypothetical protein
VLRDLLNPCHERKLNGDALCVKTKLVLGVACFSIDIFTFLGLSPCVTKGKWKKGKREKQARGMKIVRLHIGRVFGHAEWGGFL